MEKTNGHLIVDDLIGIEVPTKQWQHFQPTDAYSANGKIVHFSMKFNIKEWEEHVHRIASEVKHDRKRSSIFEK